jgi:predicted dehydrogenase
MTARDSNVRVAVLGAAHFAEIAHIPGINAHANARVVALYGRDIERTRAMAERCGVPEATSDLEGLLARPDIDAVTVVSSDDMHHPYTMAALRAGKHVFCEKPMALNERQAAEMTVEAQQRGVVHQMAFTFRHNYGLTGLRRMVEAGEIGAPYYVEVHFEWMRRFAHDAAITWRDHDESHASGELGEMGSHFIDTANFIAGPFGGFISEITAITHTRPRANATVDLGSALFRTAGGIEGQFLISRVTAAPAPYGQIHGDGLRGHFGYVIVTGEQGALCTTFSRGDVESLRRMRPGGDWERVDLPAEAHDGKPHSIPIMLGRFVDAIRDGRDQSGIAATFDDGFRSQAAIDAALMAARNRTWEKVAAEPPPPAGSSRIRGRRGRPTTRDVE